VEVDTPRERLTPRAHPMHPEVHETVALLKEHQEVHGFDPFGFQPDILPRVLPLAHFLYREYFRVATFGMEKIPNGRVLLIANHSGQLPFDAAMIATAMLLELRPPRVTRSMIEKWVPTLPFVSMLMTRCGQVVGTPANARALLAGGHPILVFPEGSRGISKTFDRRYKLEEFGLGFARLAIETQTPIVPIAVVGAEEQLPSLYNARGLAKILGMPALPIVPNGLIPLPVKYRIYFGDPITLDGDHDDEDRVIRAKVDRVVRAIEAMISRGLHERRSIFT